MNKDRENVNAEVVGEQARIIELAPHRWAKADEELERYCRGPWLRYAGNLRDGNHRAKLPTMDEQEAGWGSWRG